MNYGSYVSTYRVSQKKNTFVFFLAITPFWKGLEIKVGGVLNIQEIFFQIDTNIFQFDLLEAEKIGSKDCNPT